MCGGGGGGCIICVEHRVAFHMDFPCVVELFGLPRLFFTQSIELSASLPGLLCVLGSFVPAPPVSPPVLQASPGDFD